MSRRIPKCAGCGADCYCLGYKVEIPKKADARLESPSPGKRLPKAVTRVREAHSAERRIADLRSLGPNKDREKNHPRVRRTFVANHSMQRIGACHLGQLPLEYEKRTGSGG
jgi:hypothetical protein